MHNNPWAYLHKTGLVKNISKSMEAGHSVPERGSPSMSKPEQKTRLGVSEAKIRVSRDAEFKQPDPAKTAKRVNAMGAYRNMDKAHSGKYEKLEKKVIRGAGLKGSVEKVLSQGHNTHGESMAHEKKESKAHERGESKSFEAKENRGKSSNSAVAKKTAYMIHEGKDPKQAYAIANSMKRAGRLTSKGGYKRVKKR